MFRPQFFWPTPPGAKDVPFVRPVTYGTDVNIQLLPGRIFQNFLIQMDYDAPQFIRSMFWQGEQQGQGAGTLARSVQVQLVDAFGVDMTDGYIPLWLFGWGSGVTPPDGGSGRCKVFEPEIYCPPGSVLKLNFFNPDSELGILPTSFLGPYLQSPAQTRVQMENYPVGGAGQGAAIISYGGALYQVLQKTSIGSGGLGDVGMFKSTDNGATWTELDAGNGPSNASTPTGGAYFDGVNTFTIASTNGSRITPVAHPILLQDFDLVSGTWGAVYGAGSANVYGVNQAYKRSDGSLLVIAADNIGASASLTAFVWDGVSWSSFGLTSGLPVGWKTDSSSSTVYESATGTIHMFGIAVDGALAKHQYYQQILLTNSVAGFQDLTGVYSAASAMGNPVLIGDQIVWGVMDAAETFASIIVGSPLSAPAFSFLPSPGVLPTQPIPGLPNTMQPTLAFDGTTLWAVFSGDGTSDIVYMAFNQNLSNLLSGWDGGIVYDDPSGTIFGGLAQYPTMAIINGLPLLTYQGHDGLGAPTNYVMYPVGGGGSAVLLPGLLELRGVKRFPVGCA